MATADLESQLPDPPIRKLSIISRMTTGTFRQRSLSNDVQNGAVPLKTFAVEEGKVFPALISLLIDNQPITPALEASCHWYKRYLRIKIKTHWTLIRSALSSVEQFSSNPRIDEFDAVISFILEIARQLITKKDLALTDIVDELANAKHFKTQLDEDENRVIPNQLVFTVIGWLLLVYEVQPVQGQHTLQIMNALATSSFSSSNSTSKNFKAPNLDFDYIDQPLFMLLNQFGDILPDVKPETSRNAMNNFLPASESIAVQLICFGTVHHVTQLTIEWVDSLNLHLELDVSRRTLKLFRFPSYCRMMYHKQNIHRQLLTDHIMSTHGHEKEPVVHTAEFFREILLTYRALFGQDDRSFRAFQHAMPSFDLNWDFSARDPLEVSDPMLPLLCGKCWTVPEARCVYEDIDAGAVRDFYDSNEDFPILGQRLLQLQLFVKEYHPRTLRGLLRDRRDPAFWYSFWTNQTLLLFGCLTILICLLQLVFQIWQVVLARQQLLLSVTPVSVSRH